MGQVTGIAALVARKLRDPHHAMNIRAVSIGARCVFVACFFVYSDHFFTLGRNVTVLTLVDGGRVRGSHYR